MAQKILIKHSDTQGAVPTTVHLDFGEMGLNTYDGKLFLKRNNGGGDEVVEVGADGASHEASSDPTVNDDIAAGFFIGQTWVNTVTDEAYILVDGTTAAAIWIHVNSAGGTITGGANTGAGEGVYKGINGTNLEFKTLTAASNKVSVSSTADEVSIDIVPSNITTLGTITSGTWSATTIAVTKGGTGATTAAGARTNLGLVIGTDVEAADSTILKEADVVDALDSSSIIAPLSANQGKVLKDLVDGASAGLTYRGLITLNADVNMRTEASEPIASITTYYKGDFFKISNAGAFLLTDGTNTLEVTTGDMVIVNTEIAKGSILVSTHVDKVDNTDSVASVAGKTGTVVLTSTDVGLGNVANLDTSNADNISDGATNAIITKTQETNFETAYTHSQAAHAPSTAEQNVQVDWNQASTGEDDYIKNKPTVVSAFTNDANYLTNTDVIDGGSY